MTHPTEQPDGAHGECTTDDLVRSSLYATIEQQAARIAELSAALDGAKTALGCLVSWADELRPDPAADLRLARDTLATLPDVSAEVAAIEARALREAADIAESRMSNTILLMSNPPKSSAAFEIAAVLRKLAEQKERGA